MSLSTTANARSGSSHAIHNQPVRPQCRPPHAWILAVALVGLLPSGNLNAAPLSAGAAKVDITNTTAGPVNDPLYVKALVLKSETMTAVIITVDAVAIGEIGHIKNSYLSEVRAQLTKDLNIKAANVLVNASHCHGIVCEDVAQRTVQAVKAAYQKLEPVTVGTGVGREDRVMENRRLKLKNGREADVRNAYSLPADAEIAGVGPIDPEIGILRLDRKNGQPLAVVYNFACHPIQSVPSGGNTADMTGFASQLIEDSMGDDTIALFIQGCAGDINPAHYKDAAEQKDAEPLGNLLGLSTMRAAKKIKCQEPKEFQLINETIELPRGDLLDRIASLETEVTRLTQSLQGTPLNFKTFMPLYVKSNASPDFPSYHSYRYLQDKLIGRDDQVKLDARNKRNMEIYIKNIQVMEELTRVQTNLALLKKHQAQHVAAGRRTLDVELLGLRLGDFVLVSFPGELTVQIGLNIKQASPHENTFVAGYTNGYIYYAPTAEQLLNLGGAQEDSDCLLAPEWQAIYEKKVSEMLKKL